MTAELQAAAQQAARHKKACEDTIAQVYNLHQDFVRCAANDREILGLINEWTNHSPDVLPSLELFEEALAVNPDLSGFARQSMAVTREQLSEDILSILRAKGKGHDAYSLKNEAARLKTLSIPQLRTRLADLQRAANMATQPVADLKKIVAAGRPVHGYPELPKAYWNGTANVPLDATAFRMMDVYELKRYTRIYGSEAVNRRLGETQ
jgi:hypothetical protein